MDRPEHAVFARTVREHFPGALPESVFVANTATQLGRSGFSKDNTLACVALCRDEIATPLLDDVARHWGSVFSLASLAGMLTAGTTGFAAAIDHVPIHDGRGHFVVYAMPHIAVDADGTIGQVMRPGVPGVSTACGALSALRSELLDGTVDLGFNRLDAEQSMLKQRLVPQIVSGDIPGLIELTKLVADAVETDLSKIFGALTAAWAVTGRVVPTDAAMFTGIQIHGPAGMNLVWPRASRIEVGGDLSSLERGGTLTA